MDTIGLEQQRQNECRRDSSRLYLTRTGRTRSFERSKAQHIELSMGSYNKVSWPQWLLMLEDRRPMKISSKANRVPTPSQGNIATIQYNTTQKIRSRTNRHRGPKHDTILLGIFLRDVATFGCLVQIRRNDQMGTFSVSSLFRDGKSILLRSLWSLIILQAGSRTATLHAISDLDHL
jgi:hypothetical protein